METRADGTLVANPGRMGPLTMDARRMGLRVVLQIQDDINERARAEARPEVSLINDEEFDRIRELIEANTWPNRWTGDEMVADEATDRVLRDGTVQPLLRGILEI